MAYTYRYVYSNVRVMHDTPFPPPPRPLRYHILTLIPEALRDIAYLTCLPYSVCPLDTKTHTRCRHIGFRKRMIALTCECSGSLADAIL